MWKGPRHSDDPFITPKQESPPGMEYEYAWAPRIKRASRFWRPRITPLRTILFLTLTAAFLLLRVRVTFNTYNSNSTPSQLNTTTTNTPYPPPFPPPSQNPYRSPDTKDTFASYAHRETCNISSLSLHTPFSPLCNTRSQMVEAMSSGGRIGVDAPYMPRGCDMRWFTTEEICEILGRFERVVIVGDSMMRHVMGSLGVLVREDLGAGGVTGWNFGEVERRECFCNEQFDVKACSVQGIYRTADVVKNDSGSLKCTNPIEVIMELIVRHPIPTDEINRLKASIGQTPTQKRKAFILGHGLWSNLNHQQSLKWIDKILEIITDTVSADSEWDGLFVTPNAAGKGKPDMFLVEQGNKALVLFEEGMCGGLRGVGVGGFGNGEMGKRGLDCLGTWNMSIQANTYDGVHMDMRGNLVKAMMVMNWLNLLPGGGEN